MTRERSRWLDDLGKKFPEDTIIQFNYLPTLRARLALNKGNPAEAIESLRAAIPYDLCDVNGCSLELDNR